MVSGVVNGIIAVNIKETVTPLCNPAYEDCSTTPPGDVLPEEGVEPLPPEPRHPSGGNLLPYQVVIEGTTISDNTYHYAGSAGGPNFAISGAIALHGPIDAFITGSTISRNHNNLLYDNRHKFLWDIEAGGGITASNIRSLRVENSTISENETSYTGGGIFSRNTDTIELTNVTIVNNKAYYQGGGLFIVGGTAGIDYQSPQLYDEFTFRDDEVVTLVNSIIAGNIAQGVSAETNASLNDHMDGPSTGGTASAFAARYENTHDVWFALPNEDNVLQEGSDFLALHSLSVESSNNIIGVGIDPSLTDADGHFDRALPISNGDANNNKIGMPDAPLDPRLAPLGDYGGNTETHAILVGFTDPLDNSPALDNGRDLEYIKPLHAHSSSYRADVSSAFNLISEAITLEKDDVVDAADLTTAPSKSDGSNADDIDQRFWASPKPPETDQDPAPDYPFRERELRFEFHTERDLDRIVLWGAGAKVHRPRIIRLAFYQNADDTWDNEFEVNLENDTRTLAAEYLVDNADWNSFRVHGKGLEVKFGQSIKADMVRLTIVENGDSISSDYQTALSEVRFGALPLEDQRGGIFDRYDGTIDIGAYESPAEFSTLPTPVNVDPSTYQLEVGNLTEDTIDLELADPANLTLREAILLANLHPGPQSIAIADLADVGQINLIRGELRISDFTTISNGLGTDRITLDVSDSYHLVPGDPEHPNAQLPGPVDLYGNPNSPFPVAFAGARNLLGSRVFNIDDGFNSGPFVFDIEGARVAEPVNAIPAGGSVALSQHSEIGELSSVYRYRLIDVRNGHIANISYPGEAIEEFSAADFNAGNIAFYHDNSTYSGPGQSISNQKPSFELQRVLAVTLEDLELTGGLVQGSGGAIRTTEDLTLSNSIVHDNSVYDLNEVEFRGEGTYFPDAAFNFLPEVESPPRGGGIYGEHAIVTINNSEIKNNSSDTSGGGIHIEDGTLLLTNSKVRSNVVRKPIESHLRVEFDRKVTGGGIAIVNGYGETSRIENSTIDGNIALTAQESYLDPYTRTFLTDNYINNDFSHGGGVFVQSSDLDIVGSTISNNEARQGGGIYLIGDTEVSAELLVTNSTISGNEAKVRSVQSTADSATRTFGGGIAALENADLLLFHSTVTENAALSVPLASSVTIGSGGGIYFPNTVLPGTLKIDHSVIAGNAGLTNFDPIQHATDPQDGEISNYLQVFSDITYAGSTQVNQTYFTVENSLIGEVTRVAGLLQQSPLSGRWEDGGIAMPDANGNLIGGELIGHEVSTGLYYGGYLDPKLDVLAYNGGETKTHAPLAQGPAPLALIRPASAVYASGSALTDETGFEVGRIIDDPIVGFGYLSDAEKLTLPYLHNKLLLQQRIRGKSWQTVASGGASEDYFDLTNNNEDPTIELDLGRRATLSEMITWASISPPHGYDNQDEAESFTLKFFLEGDLRDTLYIGEPPSGQLSIGNRNLPEVGASQVFDFGYSIEADKVEITITDNFGGDRVALGQIRFVGSLLAPNSSGFLPSTISPLIDAGKVGFDPADPDGIPSTDDQVPHDQRGSDYDRIFDPSGASLGVIDIGAHESGSHPTGNSSPTLEFALVASSLPENIDTANGIKVADIVVDGHQQAPLSFQIDGSDSQFFETRLDEYGRETRELWLKPGVEFDFEAAVNNPFSVTVTATDSFGSNQSSAAVNLEDAVLGEDIGFSIEDINDRPTLTGKIPGITLARNETPKTNEGIAVSALLVGASDEDELPTPDLLGMAVTAVSVGENAPNSRVEFSLDGGATWQLFSGLFADRALLLPGDALVRFNLLDDEQKITDVIKFRVWDGEQGAPGELVFVKDVEESLSDLVDDEPFGVDMVVIPRLGKPFAIDEEPLAGSQEQSVVSVDIRGKSIHAWKDGNGLYARRVDSSGKLLDSKIEISSDSTASRPQLVGTPDGGFIVVWEEYAIDRVRLKARRVNLTTSGLSEEDAVNLTSTVPIEGQELTSLALVNTDNLSTTFMATWVDGSNGHQIDRFRIDNLNGTVTSESALVAAQIFGPSIGDVREKTQVVVAKEEGVARVAWINAGGGISINDYDLTTDQLGASQVVPVSSSQPPNASAVLLNRTIEDMGLGVSSHGDLIVGWLETFIWEENGQLQQDAIVYSARKTVTNGWTKLDGSSLSNPGEPEELARASSHSIQASTVGEVITGFSLDVDSAGRIGLAWTKVDPQSPENSFAITQWVEDEEGVAVVKGPYEQIVSGNWSEPRLAANGAGRFVLTATQHIGTETDIVAQQFELNALHKVNIFFSDDQFVIDNTQNTAQQITPYAAVYGGIYYLGVNDTLTELPIYDGYRIKILGGSNAETIDLSSTTLSSMPIEVQANSGDDTIIAGAGIDIVSVR